MVDIIDQWSILSTTLATLPVSIFDSFQVRIVKFCNFPIPRQVSMVKFKDNPLLTICICTPVNVLLVRTISQAKYITTSGLFSPSQGSAMKIMGHVKHPSISLISKFIPSKLFQVACWSGHRAPWICLEQSQSRSPEKDCKYRHCIYYKLQTKKTHHL